MNRRGFFKMLATATAGFTILPPATTYNRLWKATRVLNPEWVNADSEMGFIFNPAAYAGQWKFISSDSWSAMIKPGEFPRGAGEIR